MSQPFNVALSEPLTTLGNNLEGFDYSIQFLKSPERSPNHGRGVIAFHLSPVINTAVLNLEP
jgi:hypothetical protein